MPYRKVRNLSPVDAGYVAGIIDGEGTVTLARRHARDRRQLVVSVSSTERCILEWLQDTIGVGKITGKRVTSDSHAPGFAYSISNRQALDLLRQVAALLRSYKKDRVQMALADYVALTPRNGKYSVDLSRRRDLFERRFLAITAHGRAAERDA